MPAITTSLWFDKEAAEAAQLYTSLFPQSRVRSTTLLHDTPSGTAEMVDVDLAGQGFTLLSAGPYFRFTPAISLLVACQAKEEVDALWQRLSEQGSVLMELGEYPFSGRYGWLADRYGLSWQLMSVVEGGPRQKITPTLMFVGQQCGRAEEAVDFYTAVFPNSKVDHKLRYGPGLEPEKPETIQHAGFALDDQAFAAMDSGLEHRFTFNEAISFIVHCRTQEEIDYYWGKLSATPEAEQCGWLKDKFGVSWQIVPTVMGEMMQGDAQAFARVTAALLQMRKLDIAALKRAYAGEE